jgi:hypothetical protein
LNFLRFLICTDTPNKVKLKSSNST